MCVTLVAMLCRVVYPNLADELVVPTPVRQKVGRANHHAKFESSGFNSVRDKANTWGLPFLKLYTYLPE